MNSSALTFERSYYIGNYLSGILLGVQIVLFILSVYFSKSTTSSCSAMSRFLFLYGLCLLLFLSVLCAADALGGQLAWVEHDPSDGMSSAFIIADHNLWTHTIASAAGTLIIFMGDGLLIYRCYIIWESNWKVIVLPVVTLLATTTLSSISVYESSRSNFFDGKSAYFNLPSISISVSLNIIVTLLICSRLLAARHWMKSLEFEDSKVYTSAAAMIIESAAPVSVLGIAYIVSYASHSPTAVAFAEMWTISCAISPQLIIFRVVLGKAWSKDTIGRMTSIRFVKDTQTEDSSSRPEITESSTWQSYEGGDKHPGSIWLMPMATASQEESCSHDQESMCSSCGGLRKKGCV